MDRIIDPLWKRLDDFVRIVIAAFFVAIFAVGGVYLTPDLKTPAEWVSWTQLLIAGLIFSRKTQPLASAGIVVVFVIFMVVERSTRADVRRFGQWIPPRSPPVPGQGVAPRGHRGHRSHGGLR